MPEKTSHSSPINHQYKILARNATVDRNKCAYQNDATAAIKAKGGPRNITVCGFFGQLVYGDTENHDQQVSH